MLEGEVGVGKMLGVTQHIIGNTAMETLKLMSKEKTTSIMSMNHNACAIDG